LVFYIQSGKKCCTIQKNSLGHHPKLKISNNMRDQSNFLFEACTSFFTSPCKWHFLFFSGAVEIFTHDDRKCTFCWKMQPINALFVSWNLCASTKKLVSLLYSEIAAAPEV
jgi:hypothetical protein